MLAKRTNAMWDILHAKKEETKQVLIYKSVRLQTKYMGTRRISVTVNGATADNTEYWLGAYF